MLMSSVTGCRIDWSYRYCCRPMPHSISSILSRRMQVGSNESSQFPEKEQYSHSAYLFCDTPMTICILAKNNFFVMPLGRNPLRKREISVNNVLACTRSCLSRYPTFWQQIRVVLFLRGGHWAWRFQWPLFILWTAEWALFYGNSQILHFLTELLDSEEQELSILFYHTENAMHAFNSA